MDGQHTENKGLYAALSEYNDSDYYPYHMPGHKRSRQAGEMAEYYGIDITEIDGFDNLHHAQGILLEAQQRANRLYGAEETFYLVDGSTCGVLASIMTAAGKGGELLIARNCHKSVYHAAIMQELQLHYYYPPLLREYGIYGGVMAQDIALMLERYPHCEAVVITSPTYEGIISDIKAVADAVHEKGKILIVDEAHGAHLGLSKDMPRGAVAYGADLVIHSLHKTLPSMTQSALLHVQGERVNRRRLHRYLAMLQTSSPSYVMMASMDSCIRYVEEYGTEKFAQMRHQYDLFCKKIQDCKYLKIGKMTNDSYASYECGKTAEDVKQHGRQRYTAWDIGKLVIFTQNTSLNGQQLYDILREEYHLQMEMAAGNYVVAIMTIMDTQEGWQRLADALLQIDGRIEKGALRQAVIGCEVKTDGRSMYAAQHREEQPKAVMTPAQAFDKQEESVLLEEAVGRIAADFVNLYPPGIPILVPGEVMSENLLGQIRESARCGLQVQGVRSEGKIAVVC